MRSLETKIKLIKLSTQENFVLPTPSGETEDEFIGRCMSELNSEFPDQDQRYAVCKSQWDSK